MISDMRPSPSQMASTISNACAAIGVSTTLRVAKSTGYTVAISTFVIGVLLAGGLAAIFNR